MSSNYIVAFCGLPSSGKSTLINSLLGERILSSGVCRTTTEANILNDKIIIDDDDNEFIAIDLPGICDSEEQNLTFNDITYEHIKKSNLIYFVSDITKAFITTHEVNEYQKIKDIVNKLQKDSGTIYDVAIILTKCDFDPNPKIKKHKDKKKITTKNKEISDSDEDTNLSDIVDKVKEKFPDENIVLFNSFGRIKYKKNISAKLTKFVEKNCTNLTKHNISFSITKYVKNIKERQEKIWIQKFNELFDLYLNTTIEKSYHGDIRLVPKDITNIFNKLNRENKYVILKQKSSMDNFIHHNFTFVNSRLDELDDIFCDEISYIAYYRIRTILYLLNNDTWKTDHSHIDYKSFISRILFRFEQLNLCDKHDFIEKILFDPNFVFNITYRVDILNELFKNNENFDKYDFKKKFNSFVKLCKYDDFIKFYELIMLFTKSDKNINNDLPDRFIINDDKILEYQKCNRCNQKYVDFHNSHACIHCRAEYCIISIKEFKQKFIYDSDTIVEFINDYLKKYDEYINNDMFILRNKIMIIKDMIEFKYSSDFCSGYNTKVVSQSYEFLNCKITPTNPIFYRIMNHPEYKKITDSFYKKLVGKWIVPFDSDAINEMTFLSIDELLYNIE